MPGKKQKAKERLDKYYELAHQFGYRSRASYKLIQLNQKYDFLKGARTLVDLCAAPGSWSQVAAQVMPAGSTIIGVDLVKIAPLKGCKFLQGDIMTDKTRNQIKQMLDKKKCEVVIHDGAPNVGGTYTKDAFNQNLLTLKATKLACELLLPNGWYITKVFRSNDSMRLQYVFRQLFEKVEQFKPAASRQQSAEVFYVCAGYKAPKRLDADFFSAKRVFQMIGDEAQRADKSDPTAGKASSKANQLDPYEGKDIMHSKVRVEDFLAAEDPKQFLNLHNQIIWDGSEDLLTHKLTNNDVKECFKDLKVISKWDQNKLIKWAKAINRERDETVQDEKDAAREAARLHGEVDDASEDDEEKILGEIEAMHKRQDKAKKRAERKMIDRKLSQAERLGYNPEDHTETATAGDYFEFSKADMSHMPAEIDAKDYDDNADVAKETEIAGLDIHKRDEQGRDTVMDVASDDDDDDDDGDEESDGHDVELGAVEDGEVRKAKRDEDKGFTTTADYYKGIERVFDNAYRNREDYESDEVMSGDDSDAPQEPEKWIDSSEENDSSTDDDDDDSDSVAQERAPKARRTETKTTPHATGKAKVVAPGGSGEDGEPRGQTLQQSLRAERLESKKKGKKKKTAPGGFEEVPAEMQDVETRSRTLAMAQQLLESKKRKREILESGIHRYTFNDEGAPKWFLDEEQRYNIRPLPVTKAEVEEQKARFKEINARPSKKVAEAVGRRRKRAADKLKRIIMKEKADPRMKNTSEGLTVRKMMRSKELRRKPKKVKLDPKSKAEARMKAKREAKAAKNKKGGGKRRG